MTLGITFQVYTVASDGSETAGSTLPCILAKDIASGTQAVKIAQAIPGRREYYFAKGDDAPKAKINARLYGPSIPGHDDNATAWMHTSRTTGVFGNTLLYVVSSEYLEFPAGSYWWVDSSTIKRSGGTFNIFEMELGLIRSFYTIKDEARTI